MSTENLNWILENVGSFMCKEESRTDLPSWKVDLNNDFDYDFAEYENNVLLTPLVRLSYLRYLRCLLKTNYLECHTGIKDCNDMIMKRIENCTMLMEQKALRLCMIASFYQKNMNNIMSEVKNLTKNNLLHKELGKCLCSDYVSLGQDKNIQVDIRPLKLSRGIQTPDRRPWTETDLDTLETWQITRSNHKSNRNSLKDKSLELNQKKTSSFKPAMNFQNLNANPMELSNAHHSFRPDFATDSAYTSSYSQKFPPSCNYNTTESCLSENVSEWTACSQTVGKNRNVIKSEYDLFSNEIESQTSEQNNMLSDYECWNPNSSCSTVSNQNLISINPTDTCFDSGVKDVIMKQLIDAEISSMAVDSGATDVSKRKGYIEEEEEDSWRKRYKNNEVYAQEVKSKSKVYDSLDDRLQELFSDELNDECMNVNTFTQNTNTVQSKSLEEITKELLGTDDDDLSVNNHHLDHDSYNSFDKENRSQSVCSDESIKSSHWKAELKNDDLSIDEALVNTKFDPNFSIKSYFTSWLSERVAQVCYFNSMLEQMNPEKRKALEKKLVQLFGPCCLFDNDDFTQEEQRRICHKRIAKIVCHYLRPFFRSKQIANKSLFQTIAKYMTEKMLNKHVAADEKMVKKYVQKFFEENGKIKSVENLPFSVKPKSSIF